MLVVCLYVINDHDSRILDGLQSGLVNIRGRKRSVFVVYEVVFDIFTVFTLQ